MQAAETWVDQQVEGRAACLRGPGRLQSRRQSSGHPRATSSRPSCRNGLYLRRQRLGPQVKGRDCNLLGPFSVRSASRTAS
jgi:hypothetical protein